MSERCGELTQPGELVLMGGLTAAALMDDTPVHSNGCHILELAAERGLVLRCCVLPTHVEQRPSSVDGRLHAGAAREQWRGSMLCSITLGWWQRCCRSHGCTL